MANTISDRLTLDFDTTRFGGAYYISNSAANTLSSFSDELTDWQKQELASGSISLSKYYKNPVADACANLINTVIQIRNFCSYDPEVRFPNNFAEAISTASSANGTLIQLLNFKYHTDNISGLSALSGNTEAVVDAANIPTFDSAMTQGQEVVRILYQTESVNNTMAILGCFTSIFVNEELKANSNTITLCYKDLANSYDEFTLTSNIANANLISISSDLQNVNSFVYTRRTSDWDFFKQQKNILNDYYTVNKFNSLGNTENYLINNFIGTDFLKNKLANT